MEIEIIKAIDQLKDLKKDRESFLSNDLPYYDDVFFEDIAALDTAIAALERQMPKPPTYKVHEKYPMLGKNYYCDCGVMFGGFKRNGTNYCGNCGQRLKDYEPEG